MTHVLTGVKVMKNGSLKCKCGSVSNKVIVDNDKNYEGYHTWITIICRKCHSMLYYNGA